MFTAGPAGDGTLQPWQPLFVRKSANRDRHRKLHGGLRPGQVLPDRPRQRQLRLRGMRELRRMHRSGFPNWCRRARHPSRGGGGERGSLRKNRLPRRICRYALNGQLHRLFRPADHGSAGGVRRRLRSGDMRLRPRRLRRRHLCGYRQSDRCRHGISDGRPHRG